MAMWNARRPRARRHGVPMVRWTELRVEWTTPEFWPREARSCMENTHSEPPVWPAPPSAAHRPCRRAAPRRAAPDAEGVAAAGRGRGRGPAVVQAHPGGARQGLATGQRCYPARSAAACECGAQGSPVDLHPAGGAACMPCFPDQPLATCLPNPAAGTAGGGLAPFADCCRAGRLGAHRRAGRCGAGGH